jgi:hypothetical protein
MPQSPGEDIARNLGQGFNKVISAPLNVVSDAYDSVKGALTGGSKPAPTNSGPSLMTQNALAGRKAATPTPKPKATPVKKSTPSYKTGTDYVPKTGPAILHKGEAVLKKSDADVHRAHKFDVGGELGGSEAKPKKEIDHIKTKKAKSGGYVHTHVHTHPEHHPDEQHVSASQDDMVNHMMDHMGEPNPGEAEADAGQSGIPAGANAAGAAGAGASPTGGAPAPMGA